MPQIALTVIEFTITDDHVKLLQRMYVGWDDCEFGAPAIDCKRPYGNSFVPMDMAEILGWNWPDEDEVDAEEYDRRSDELYRRAQEVHGQMQTVLQIGVRTLSFAPGLYRKTDRYGEAWERVEG